MKFVNARPFADPEAAARKLIEIANGVEAVQDGRIFIELVTWPFDAVLKHNFLKRSHFTDPTK